MGLALISVLESALFMHAVEAFDFALDRLLVVVFEPLALLLHRLLEEDVLFAILVHVLHQVDAGLVLTTPLRFPCVPLHVVLDLSQVIDFLFFLSLVGLDVLVVNLEGANFITTL